MKHLLFLLLFPFFVFAQSPNPKRISDYQKFVVPNVSKGEIRRLQAFPSRFVDARNVDVWLPANYDAAKKYAVLYMHDGQMLFDSTTTWNSQEWKVDETLSTLMETGTIRETIVVGVWNNGKYRRMEYFPQKALRYLNTETFGKLMTQAEGKPQADAYLKFLVQELKPFIDRTFSTHRNAENTFIAGSSMGGLISMYAISEYPNIFGGAACISTHWLGSVPLVSEDVPKAFRQYLEEFAPSSSNHRLYFDYGTETLDKTYKGYQDQVDEILNVKGFNAANWLTRGFVGDDHSEKSWQRRFHVPMTFLLGK